MSIGISIRPSKDLRTNYGQISALTRQTPVAITVNGREDTVLMSHEDYLAQQAALEEMKERLALYAHLAQSEDDVRLGRTKPLDTAFDEILANITE